MKNLPHTLLLLAGGLFFCTNMFAQDGPTQKPEVENPCPPQSTYTASGKVTNEKGMALRDVTYSWHGGEAKTNDAGFYKIRCLEGYVNITFSYPGYITKTITVTNLRKYKSVELQPGSYRTLSGKIIEWQTGEPVAGALIQGPGGISVNSDAQGKYSIKFPYIVNPYIAIKKDGYNEIIYNLSSPDPSYVADFELFSSGLIPVSGIVLDRYTNEKLPLANFVNETSNTLYTTDTSGIFKLYVRPEAENTINIGKAGYSQVNLEYPATPLDTSKTLNEFVIYMVSQNPTLDYFGYDSTYIPMFNYSFLRRTSVEFISNAIQLEKELLIWRQKRDDNAFRKLQMENAINIASKTLEISQKRVELSESSVAVSEESLKKIELQDKNKQEQIDRFTEYHPIATARAEVTLARVKAEENGNTLAKGAKYAESYMNGTIEAGAALGSIPVVGPIIGAIYGTAQKINAEAEQYMNMQREKKETEAMVKVAQKELTREMAALKVTQSELNKDTEQLQSLNREYRAFQSGTLSTKFWDNITELANKLYQGYLSKGTILAWMTQRAYETEYMDDVNMIRYGYTPSDTLLSAQQLLSDLNAIEYVRVTSKGRKKEIPASYIFSLAQKESLNMETLRETGKVTFTISDFEMDKAFPGTYRRQIDNIDVQIFALTDPGGIKGRFTKNALAYDKVLSGYEPGNTTDDWIQYTPSRYALLPRSEDPETMLLPEQQTNYPNPDGDGIKRLFEGRPVCGSYTLEIPEYANNFDFETIFDVVIKIDFHTYFDEELKDDIEHEFCELQELGQYIQGRQLLIPISAMYPDEFYSFQNPEESSPASGTQRIIPVKIPKDFFTSSQRKNQVIKSLKISFAGEDGLIDVQNVKLTSQRLKKSVPFKSEDGHIIFTKTNQNIDSLTWISSGPTSKDLNYITDGNTTLFVRRLDSFDLKYDKQSIVNDTWLIRIDASANPALCTDGVFDDKKIASIKDILLSFEYEYFIDFCKQIPPAQVFQKVDTIYSNKQIYFYINGSFRPHFTYGDSDKVEWISDTSNNQFTGRRKFKIGAYEPTDFGIKVLFDKPIFKSYQPIRAHVEVDYSKKSEAEKSTIEIIADGVERGRQKTRITLRKYIKNNVALWSANFSIDGMAVSRKFEKKINEKISIDYSNENGVFSIFIDGDPILKLPNAQNEILPFPSIITNGYSLSIKNLRIKLFE